MFSKSLRYQEQTRRYSIEQTDAGWEVREERDSAVVKQVRYQDWHRVERAHPYDRNRAERPAASGLVGNYELAFSASINR